MQTILTETVDRLKELGFNTAAENAVKRASLAEKLGKAYSKYLYVSEDQINKFNERLKKESEKENKNSYTYKKLKFIDIKDYTEIPPQEALDSLKDAKEDNVFDTFEITKIEDVIEQKDPILFGRIEECNDRFFITQWDDDIKIEDILFMEANHD